MHEICEINKDKEFYKIQSHCNKNHTLSFLNNIVLTLEITTPSVKHLTEYLKLNRAWFAINCPKSNPLRLEVTKIRLWRNNATHFETIFYEVNETTSVTSNIKARQGKKNEN